MRPPHETAMTAIASMLVCTDNRSRQRYALALFSKRKPSVPGSFISVPRTVRSNANIVTTRPSEMMSTSGSPSPVGPATTLTIAPLGRVIATRLPSTTSRASVGFSNLNLLPVNKGF